MDVSAGGKTSRVEERLSDEGKASDEGKVSDEVKVSDEGGYLPK